MTDNAMTADASGSDPHALPDGADAPPVAKPQLTNMRLAIQAMLQIHNAPAGVPRIGLFYGPSGYGKTEGAAHVSAQFDCVFVTAEPVWTQRAMLEAIARELGIARIERSAPKILTQIKDALTFDPRPLIIDETDFIVDRDWIEIIRAIHDATRIAVMLIGEESLPSKLKRRERFDNRVLISQPAEAATLDDALLLRDFYCTQALVADDLVADIVRACNGVTRRIVVNLQAAQARALSTGAMLIDRNSWGKAAFMTGQVQPRRRAMRQGDQ